MNIVIVELLDEAKQALKDKGKAFLSRADTKVICLHPKARAFFMSQGIPAEGTTLYLDSEAQRRIVLTCEEWLQKALKHVPFKDQYGISKGYEEYFIHHYRFYINHFLWVIEILKGIEGRHTISSLCAPIPRLVEVMYQKKAYIQDSERFVGLLTKQFAENRGVTFYPLNIETGLWHKWDDCLRTIIEYFSRPVQRWKFNKFLKALRDIDEIVVVPGLSYRMDTLIGPVKKRNSHVKCCMISEGATSFKTAVGVFSKLWGARREHHHELLDTVIYIDLLNEKHDLDRAEKRKFINIFDQLCSTLKSQAGVYSYENISVIDFLYRKVEGLKEDMIKLLSLTGTLYRVLKALHPKMLISMYSGGIFYLMGDLAHVLNFQALNISHGTHVPPSNEYERIENLRLAASVISNTYTSVAVQTPWADRFLNFYGDKRDRIYTGPLLYSKISPEDRQRMRAEILQEQDQFVVLHAATQKTRKGHRFYITETLDEYLSSLSDIVDAVNQLDNVCLVIRPHPVCHIGEEEFRLLLPESKKVFFYPMGAFSPLLSASDLLISFSSTVIEEAVVNHIPVICYDKWKRYNHFQLEELREGRSYERKPAYYVTQSGVMKRLIQDIQRAANEPAIGEKLVEDYTYPEYYKDNFFEFVSGRTKEEVLS